MLDSKRFPRKRIGVYASFVLALVVLVWGCVDDDAIPNPKAPQEICDSMAYTYVDDVAPILNTNCATSYCHGAGAAGIWLTNYDSAKQAASHGKFLKAIKHELGASPMPKTGNKLSDPDIQVLECWIQNGYLRE